MLHEKFQGTSHAVLEVRFLWLETYTRAAQRKTYARSCSRGCVVQGTIVDMLEDVNTGINWVMQKISHYGGDPEQVYLVGQSCGAQLCTLTTLLQVLPTQLLLHPYSSCHVVHSHVLGTLIQRVKGRPDW